MVYSIDYNDAEKSYMKCPLCFYAVHKPEKGDISYCAYCEIEIANNGLSTVRTQKVYISKAEPYIGYYTERAPYSRFCKMRNKPSIFIYSGMVTVLEKFQCPRCTEELPFLEDGEMFVCNKCSLSLLRKTSEVIMWDEKINTSEKPLPPSTYTNEDKNEAVYKTRKLIL